MSPASTLDAVCLSFSKTIASACLYAFLSIIYRRTRLPSTYRPVWGKLTLSSFCCSTWLIQMLPPPTATLPSIFQPGKVKRRRLPCFWRPEPHTHWAQRWAGDRTWCAETAKYLNQDSYISSLTSTVWTCRLKTKFPFSLNRKDSLRYM